MKELEYLGGLMLLILGFNIGFREAEKGMSIKDMKHLLGKILKLFSTATWK